MPMDVFTSNRLGQELQREGMDAILTASLENTYYLSGFYSTSKKMTPSVRIYGLWAPEMDKPWLILPVCDLPSAYEAGVSLEQVICYGKFYFYSSEHCSAMVTAVQNAVMEACDDIGTALEILLQKLPSNCRRLGLEYEGLLGDDLQNISAKCCKLQIKDGSVALKRARMIKSVYEVEALERAAEVAEHALMETFQQLKEGMSEAEAANLYIQRVAAMGAQPTFSVFTFGTRAAFVDTAAQSVQYLREGDMIRADVGCSVRGYQADMSRTAVLGRPDDQITTRFRAIYEGEQAAIQLACPGVAAKTLFQAAVGVVQDSGISCYQRTHCGHGLGLNISEPPNIREDVSQVLEPGMVLCIETPFYCLGWGGVQVEDTLLITSSGHRMLTKTSAELVLL